MQQKLAENEKTGINVIKCSKISVKKFTELNFLKSNQNIAKIKIITLKKTIFMQIKSVHK